MGKPTHTLVPLFSISFSFFFRQKADKPALKHKRQLTHLAGFPSSGEEISQPEDRTANLFLEIWVSLHHHLVV
jgi:hypothetical protein